MVDNIELCEENVTLVNEESEGLTADDFPRNRYLNAPNVSGETIVFTVLKVNPQVPAVQRAKKDGKGMYWDGLATSDPIKNKPFKQTILTDMGLFNIKQWELYGKLFSYKDAILIKYAESHDKSFVGAKVSITKLVNDGHASYKVEDLKKLLGFTTDAQVVKYKEDIALAQKEKRVYEVKLVE